MDDILSLDRIAETVESGVEAEVTIGEQQLVVSDDGIFDSVSGEPAGGFTDDSTADNYFEAADQALYDTGANIEFSDTGMETGSPVDTDSLIPDFETIQPSDTDVGDGIGFETGEITEAGIEASGGIEGIEAAEAGAAVEGIEAAAAALL